MPQLRRRYTALASVSLHLDLTHPLCLLRSELLLSYSRGQDWDLAYKLISLQYFLNSINALRDRSTMQSTIDTPINSSSQSMSSFPNIAVWWINKAILIIQGANTSYCNRKRPVYLRIKESAFLLDSSSTLSDRNSMRAILRHLALVSQDRLDRYSEHCV
jgi:hypothetical protein